MKFLIADDDISTRLLIRSILEDEGDEVIAEAEDGEAALEIYTNLKEKPDIVILDVYMPVMDGIEAARGIRKHQTRCLIEGKEIMSPILFLTASEDENTLAKCFDIGNEVLHKPVSPIMTKAKLNSMKRHLNMFYELRKKQKELINLNSIHEEEFALARDIFKNFSLLNNNTSGNIQYHSSPSTTFNGDIVLCTRSPMDSLYVFIGDLTGHGLPAAIAATPINKIFFTMAEKGISISRIAQELNNNLFDLLPDNIFCAAFLLEMSNNGEQIHLWSGGMPSVLVTTPDGKLKDKIPCSHMPLGSESPSQFESNIQTYSFDQNDRIYLFTDGITEAQSQQGEFFGEDKLLDVLGNHSENHFHEILKAVDDFTPEQQDDDITLVELISQPLSWPTTANSEYIKNKAEQLKSALPWEITMDLSGADFKRGDPPTQLVHFLNNSIGIDMHQDTLSTILTELYSNALEHGLMKLDSSLKADEEGFVDYYLQRSERLNTLEDTQKIQIKLRFEPCSPSPSIELTITDSGDGFDIAESLKAKDCDLHGRGQKLIDSLCHKLVYSNGGRTANATYELLRPH